MIEEGQSQSSFPAFAGFVVALGGKTAPKFYGTKSI